MPATIRSKFVDKSSDAGLFQLRIQDNITKSLVKTIFILFYAKDEFITQFVILKEQRG